jgi:hypothetical protein
MVAGMKCSIYEGRIDAFLIEWEVERERIRRGGCKVHWRTRQGLFLDRAMDSS